MLPERDSSADALRLATLLADHLGVERVVEDIEPALAALGCYDRQLEAIRMVVPEYGAGWRCKLVLPSLLDGDRLNLRVAHGPATRTAPSASHRMSRPAYLQMVAATNFKQRVRKTLEYYHADRLHYAVAGTPNRLEYDQGFFVKQGDGAADIKPIAHLYKTQVYALAAELWAARRDPAAGPHDRHLLAPAEPGGVLLRAAVPADGPVPVGARPRACRTRTPHVPSG